MPKMELKKELNRRGQGHFTKTGTEMGQREAPCKPKDFFILFILNSDPGLASLTSCINALGTNMITSKQGNIDDYKMSD